MEQERSRTTSGSLTGSLNNSYLLNATTLQNHNQIDGLFGAPSPALDWFFADISDMIKGGRTGEVTALIF